MNLSELEITKDVRERYVDWKTVFEKHGWSVLGEGIEATVGQKPGKPYVLKVFPSTSAYKAFLQFCQQTDSPYLPRFSRGARGVPGAFPPADYVRMEQLKGVSEALLFGAYMPEIAYVWIECDREGLEMNWRFHEVVKTEIEQRLGQSAYALKDSWEAQQLLWQKIGAPPPGWILLVNKLVSFLIHNTKRTELDLHAGNFMRRGTTLVITDPFSGIDS
jgi:hypothetical protein